MVNKRGFVESVFAVSNSESIVIYGNNCWSNFLPYVTYLLISHFFKFAAAKINKRNYVNNGFAKKFAKQTIDVPGKSIIVVTAVKSFKTLIIWKAQEIELIYPVYIS